MTGILDRLVAGGWLVRGEDPADRRAVIVQGTPRLEVFFKESQKAVTKILRDAFKDLPTELIARLCEDLGQVLACLEAEAEAKR